MLITHKDCRNFGSRPRHVHPSLIILHSDAGKTEEGTISWLANPKSGVSYHYLVGRGGDVYQFVDESLRAWHAGISKFQDQRDCNDFSIGCAFANRNDGEEYTTPAIRSMLELCREIMGRWPLITRERVTTHAIVSHPRKNDPVAPFDLATFLAEL